MSKAFELSQGSVGNLTATTDPGPTDDGTAGYKVGNDWINQLSGKVFTMVDASTGAAIWTAGGVSIDGAGIIIDGGAISQTPSDYLDGGSI